MAIMLIAGALAGRGLRALRLPQTVGFLLAGLLLGRSGFGILNAELLKQLSPMSACVLSLICFTIGGALKLDMLKNHKREFLSILFFGSVAPFFLVSLLLSLAGVALFGIRAEVFAVAVLLGSISLSTAPASITVLKEHHTRGPLTTIMQGIIAMDGAAGLALYAISAAVIQLCRGGGDGITIEGAGAYILVVLRQVILPLAAGGISAALLRLLTLKLKQDGALISFMFGTVLFLAALCDRFKCNPILASVAMGFVFTNIAGKTARRVFLLADTCTPPLFVLFFVLVGASTDVNAVMLGSSAVFALLYLAGRTAGKMVGTTFGAVRACAPAVVRENLRYCLLNQAGVAMGLAITAAADFPGFIGSTVLFVITAAVFVMQIAGPLGVKYAVTRAGEIHPAV